MAPGIKMIVKNYLPLSKMPYKVTKLVNLYY